MCRQDPENSPGRPDFGGPFHMVGKLEKMARPAQNYLSLPLGA